MIQLNKLNTLELAWVSNFLHALIKNRQFIDKPPSENAYKYVTEFAERLYGDK